MMHMFVRLAHWPLPRGAANIHIILNVYPLTPSDNCFFFNLIQDITIHSLYTQGIMQRKNNLCRRKIIFIKNLKS